MSDTTTTGQVDIVDSIIRYEQGDLSMLEGLELFGQLVRTGQAWTLQGHYGRTASALIEADLIEADTGNLTDRAIDRLAELPESD